MTSKMKKTGETRQFQGLLDTAPPPRSASMLADFLACAVSCQCRTSRVGEHYTTADSCQRWRSSPFNRLCVLPQAGTGAPRRRAERKSTGASALEGA